MPRESTQAKRLFLICPTSQSELFVRERYGSNSFFLTALGSVFDFGQIHYLEAVVDFIERESIRHIYIVHDTSCPFLDSILVKKKEYETHAEAVLLDLLIEHYFYVMEGDTLTEKKNALATLNVERQGREIWDNEFLRSAMSEYNINLRGIITSRAAGLFINEVDVKPAEAYI